jgi:MYXO-CTERM domain-containing protein
MIVDGSIVIPEDAGFDFEDLQVGGGCSCHVTGSERSLPNGVGALLIGLVLAWRVGRRRKR